MGNMPCTCVKQTNEMNSELQHKYEPQGYATDTNQPIATSHRVVTGTQPFINGRVPLRNGTYLPSKKILFSNKPFY